MSSQIQNYDRFLSKAALQTPKALLNDLGELARKKPAGTINFGGGMPNPSHFPFKEAHFTTHDGTEIKIDPSMMKLALQYGNTRGYAPLLQHLTRLVDQLHGPIDREKYGIAVIAGAQHGLSLSADLMINEGDYIILPEPVYSLAVNIYDASSPRYIPVPCDSQGMLPGDLRKALSKWDPKEIKNQYGNVPKIMYLNPLGNNPLGGSMSTQRKQEIYDIASEYNIFIIEDDPYFFINFQQTDGFPKSFLKMDVDGRVLRLESFSKVLSAGIRLGFMIGPHEIVNKVMAKTATSIVHCPTLIQMAVSGLLSEWGQDKFLRHTMEVRDFYKKKRDMMLSAADKHLKGICEWDIPTSGLFLWVKAIGIKDTWKMIMERHSDRKVLLVPGSVFLVDSSKCSSYMRMSYSIASEEEMDQGMQNLAILIREERSITNTVEGEKII